MVSLFLIVQSFIGAESSTESMCRRGRGPFGHPYAEAES